MPSRELFQNPTAAWRGKPFWSWNGRLDETELLRQIHVLKEMGMGGFFMHSRTGLHTEYLGDEWMRLTNVCADAGHAIGMEGWLYDEDRWPSGTAGGLVTKNPDYRARFVSMRIIPAADFAWSVDLFAAFACELDGFAYRDATRLSPGEKIIGNAVLAFAIEPHDLQSFYNGYTYVDTMNRAAIDHYIELTHERYLAECGDKFAVSIKGIFTDEPHRGPVMSGFSIGNDNRLSMAPWTHVLPGEFEKRFGYDLVDRLPELFLEKNGATVSPVKWHYMELTQQLFLENFAAPIFDWCDAHKLILTGHVLHEDNLTSQAAMQGSLMRFYEFMHYPGIDVLSEGHRNYWVAKMCQSVARQLNKPWVLSELYGCTGWQMGFRGHKEVGDWQALFGVNVRCHHLSWYTMAGEAKRDYPASISYQSAWWPQYHFVETYFSRLGMMTSLGHACCDVLVINPIESLWCQIRSGWASGLSPTTDAVRRLEKQYAELFHLLAGSQIDFDYGDEEMLGRLGGVERDDAGAAVLRLGKARYRSVVVAGMTTIRATTMTLIEAFRAAGGNVVFTADVPTYVDALPSNRAGELSDAVGVTPFELDALAAALRPTIRAAVRVEDSAGHTANQNLRPPPPRRRRLHVDVDERRQRRGLS